MPNLINHLRRHRGGRDDGLEGDPEAFGRYVTIRTRGRELSGLVDSGNTFRCCISSELLSYLDLELGRDVVASEQSHLGTAKDGANLKILGELSKPLEVFLGSHPTKLKIRPLVIQGLSHDLNLSGPFLQKYNISQLHGERCLLFQGKRVPLAATPLRAPRGVTEDAVHVVKETVVPPGHVAHLELQSSKVRKGIMHTGPVILTGRRDRHGDLSVEGREVGGFRRAGLHPVVDAVENVDRKGKLLGAVLNTTDSAITVGCGTLYGHIESTYQGQQPRVLHLASTPATPAVSAVLPPGSESSPPDSRSPQTPEEKIQWLIENCNLKDSEHLQDPDQMKKCTDLLLKYFDVFARDGEFGSTHLLQHEIDTGDHPPLKTRYRPVPPALEGSLKKTIDQWLDSGVIQPSKSPWSFGLVAVPKKNGETRWCVGETNR